MTLPLVRLAMELGADVIKADMTPDPKDFSKLISVCSPLPVLVRGGAKGDWEDVLMKSRALMSSGARGLVYGRNIMWVFPLFARHNPSSCTDFNISHALFPRSQHKDPSYACKKFMEIVHASS